MKALYISVILAIFLWPLAGCALADWAAGIGTDGNGNVVVTNPDGSPAQVAMGLLAATGVAGTGVGGVLGYALKAYRHHRIVSSGGKDDNFDGVPDQAPTKPA